MNKSYIRRYNANTIFHRIRIEPRISQRDIVAKTGIDKSVVSSIVSQFNELGLIKRESVAGENRPGRPVEGLTISPKSGLIVGVQIEAETIGYVISALDGLPLSSRVEPFNGDIQEVASMVARGVGNIALECGCKGKILGVGISLPGLMTHDGVLLHAPVLGWRDVSVSEMFSSVLDAPIFPGNDGKAAAMAEHMFGECVDIGNFLYLFSGSGVGGALFLDGDIYGGSTGLAGELGHIKVLSQGRYCSCGSSGCLSAYLSEPALAEEIGRLTGRRPSVFREIVERAETKEDAVLSVLDNAGVVLGSAISSLVNIFNPPLVCLGGDMALAEPYLRPAVERTLRRQAHPSMSAQTRVLFSRLSTVSPYLGGVALALDGVTGLESPHILP